MNKETGGSAFPVPPVQTVNGDMYFGVDGMTLRDYFAAKAMQAFIGGWNGEGDSKGACESFAKVAYKQADAMIAERAK